MTAPGSGPAALEQLATALGPAFITTLITGPGHPARLNVTSRNTRAGQDVYADDNGWYRWPWAEPIAATDDPQTAAHHITAALHGTAAARQRP